MSGIVLSWTRQDNNPSGSWEIYRSVDGSVGSLIGTVTDPTTTSYTDTATQAGQTYHYTVRRITPDAQTDSAQITAAPPDAPSDLSLSYSDTVDLSWTDNAGGPDGFAIYRADGINPSWPGDFELIWTITDGSTTYSDPMVRTGGTYHYAVTAYGGNESTATTDSIELTEKTLSVTTQLPDAQQPMLDTTVEDEMGVETSDVTNYGDYRIQIRETGETAWDGTAVGYHEAVLASDADLSGQITTTFQNLEDGEEFECRVRTETEHVTGAWTTPVSGTLPFPAPTGFTITSRFDTVEATYVDNSDHADEVIKLQRSLDGGQTWETVATYTANTTDVDDSSPVFYEVVDYRIRQESEHTFAYSNAVTDVVARSDDGFWAEVHKPDAPNTDNVLQTAIGPSRIQGVDQLSLEHTAISGWQLTVAPAFEELRDYHLGKVTIYSGNQRLIRGPLQRTPQSAGTITLAGEGPGHALRTDTTVATYNNQPVWMVLDDYKSYLPADSWTVHEPFVRVVDDDETFVDVPIAGSLADLFEDGVSDTYPVVTAFDTLRVARTGWFLEAEDATYSTGFGNPTTVNSGSWGTLSGDAGVQFDSSGQAIEWTITPEHDIPAEEFGYAFRWSLQSFTGNLTVTLDGETLESLNLGGGDQSMQWIERPPSGFSTPSFDLAEGVAYTLRFESTTDGGSFSGGFTVDAAFPHDTGSRLGGFSYTYDNSVETTNYTVDGPQEYPTAIRVSATEPTNWHVSEATLSITVDDSGLSRLALSSDGSQFVTTSNASSITADFDAQQIWGNDVTMELDLGRQTNDTTTSPATGDAPQTVSELTLNVTTDDLPLITGTLTLDGESWFQNLKTLHTRGDMRFVVDHREDGLVAESFRTGDPDLVQPADWTTDGVDAVQGERTTEEYANVVHGHPPDDGFSTITLQLSEEIARVNAEESRAIVTSSNVREEAVIEVRDELRRRVGLDEFSGSIQIHPTYVKPGYPYEPDAFDGDRANLERVSLSKGSGGASGSLSFGRSRDLVAAIRRGGN